MMKKETIRMKRLRTQICSIVGISRLIRTTTCMEAKESADRIIKRMPFCFCVIFMMSSCEIVIEE